ncbi:unnamed protein product [Rhizopus stolonifer]
MALLKSYDLGFDRWPERGSICEGQRSQPRFVYFIYISYNLIMLLHYHCLGLYYKNARGTPQYLTNYQNQLVRRETSICASQTCQSAAKSILDSIDFNVDPCDSFYQYTCGAWAKHHNIPDSQSC